MCGIKYNTDTLKSSCPGVRVSDHVGTWLAGACGGVLLTSALTWVPLMEIQGCLSLAVNRVLMLSYKKRQEHTWILKRLDWLNLKAILSIVSIGHLQTFWIQSVETKFNLLMGLIQIKHSCNSSILSPVLGSSRLCSILAFNLTTFLNNNLCGSVQSECKIWYLDPVLLRLQHRSLSSQTSDNCPVGINSHVII